MGDGFLHGLGHEGLGADEGPRRGDGLPRTYRRTVAMAPGSGGSGTSDESDEDDEDDGSTGADDLHLAPGRAEVLAIGRGKGGCLVGKLKTTT